MKWCELREYKWNEYVTIAVNRNLSNCEIARKKVFRGFNGIRTRGLCVSAAVLSQLSYEDPYTGGWPIYWVHQPVKGMKHWMKWCELREYKWNEYVTIAVNRNLSSPLLPYKSILLERSYKCLTYMTLWRAMRSCLIWATILLPFKGGLVLSRSCRI